MFHPGFLSIVAWQYRRICTNVLPCASALARLVGSAGYSQCVWCIAQYIRNVGRRLVA